LACRHSIGLFDAGMVPWPAPDNTRRKTHQQ
jgi:hypothetical protein